MAQYGFGSGSFWGVDSGANPTPGRFGELQDVGVDFSFNLKELYGQKSFPATVARGVGKIACKGKLARFQGRILNSLFFNNTKAAGQVSVAQDEAGAIPTTPFQITVANGATFADDLGVRNATTGIPMTRVASAPATGQYSVNTTTGVYTFATADTGVSVKIDYSYTIASTGEKISIANAATGLAPNFKGVFTQSYNSLRQTLVLNACVSSKLSIASKLEDFNMQDFDFAGMADSAENIGTWSLGEAS
jgi:hypothetical protein